MDDAVECRFIDRCLDCLRGGCIWLQETIAPCRQNLHDVEMKPSGVIYNETGCPETNRNEPKVYTHAVVAFRHESFGLHWISAMMLCMSFALMMVIWFKCRNSYGTRVQSLINFLRRR